MLARPQRSPPGTHAPSPLSPYAAGVAGRVEVEEVEVDGEDVHVPHTVHTIRLGQGPPLVLVHGFAAAVGHWAWYVCTFPSCPRSNAPVPSPVGPLSEPTNQPLFLVVCVCVCVCVCRNSNLDELAKHHTVYAIDLVGFGRSSRPAFTPEVRHATCGHLCVCVWARRATNPGLGWSVMGVR
jgi:pimeloyl-ACP methyl ester carboxylesterase